MPKKYYRRKKTAHKPTLVRQVAAIKKLVAIRAPEKKYYDVASTANVVDNLPSINITPYRNITQGTGDFANRIGDQIRVTGPLRLKTTWTLAAAANATRVRMFAFIFKRNPDAVTSTWSTVVNLYLSSAYMNTTSAVMADRDHDNAGSFVTLYDQVRVLNVHQSTVNNKILWDVNIKVPSTYSKVGYVNAGTTVSQNELFIGFLQENDGAVTVDYHYRFYYVDA